MKRRSFVLKSLSALPLAGLASGLFLACKKKETSDTPSPDSTVNTSKKVIVVGAGISGLAASKKLKEKGFEVVLLEASNGAGGRIKTDYSAGIPFDLGASWIHGPNGNPITDIAVSSGATTYMTDDENLAVFDEDGTEYQDAVLDPQYSQFLTALDEVEFEGTKTQSFETVFTNLYPSKMGDKLWIYMLSAYLEFDTGGDIRKLSSIDFYNDSAFPGKDVIITNGYDKIIDYLKQDLDIRMNEPMLSIDARDKIVKVISSSGTHTGVYVLVTIPLGILKQVQTAFLPVLPQYKLDAINGTEMGIVNKFLLIWDSPFWDNSLQYIGYTPATKGKFNYFINCNKFMLAYALMTFAFGDYAGFTESLTDAQVTDEIMTHLKSIYGNAIPNPVKMIRTKWQSDENTKGSYSFATNGIRTSAFDDLAEPLNNRIFFAGEHTHRAYRGTVHGAYLSGIREANRIIDL